MYTMNMEWCLPFLRTVKEPTAVEQFYNVCCAHLARTPTPSLAVELTCQQWAYKIYLLCFLQPQLIDLEKATALRTALDQIIKTGESKKKIFHDAFHSLARNASYVPAKASDVKANIFKYSNAGHTVDIAALADEDMSGFETLVQKLKLEN